MQKKKIKDQSKVFHAFGHCRRKKGFVFLFMLILVIVLLDFFLTITFIFAKVIFHLMSKYYLTSHIYKSMQIKINLKI
jgi:hypothetical protein